VYEPLPSPSRVLSHYGCTISCHSWFVTRLWLSEIARCTQRAFFEATNGECDKLDTTSCQQGMNGDALMKTFAPHIPVTRVECEASNLSLPHDHWWHGRAMTGMFTSSRSFSQSTLCISNVLMCLPIQSPKHNGLNHRLSRY
ncbi:unnamed protein product, partial [Penicillium salamii]